MTLPWNRFPPKRLGKRTSLHRIHQAARGAAHYSTRAQNRFDAPRSSPVKYGVCYLGIKELTSYVEVLGRVGTATVDDIDSLRLTSPLTTRGLVLADLTDPSVVGNFNVTLAHSTSSDYTQSQALSLNLHNAGCFDGIYYLVRHDPRAQLAGVALFDSWRSSGSANPLQWGTAKTLPMRLIETGTQRYGIRVLPPLDKL